VHDLTIAQTGENVNVPRCERPTARLVLAAVMLALTAVVGLSACAKGAVPTTSQVSAQDRKTMMESVAKWYVAQGAADLGGIRAAVYDPTNILGLATATPLPSEVETVTIVWKWVGNKIALTIPGMPEEPTMTVAASPTTPTVVEIDDGTGLNGALYMKKVDGVWKIDITETQKALDAAAAQEDTSAPPESP
jgi:hypothetical protein